MAISIYFESYFRQQPYENAFKPENYQEWCIEERWSVTPNVVQEITLVNEDEYFESYYYVDLEIVSALQESDAKISKSRRMASNNIKFLIRGNEFSCFQTYRGIVDVNSENYARDHLYRYKITLTPIFQLCDEPFRKPGKRTKIDLLGGLKTLSNDIVSMKGQLFSDITIYCGNKRVKAHRNILYARSTVFKKFLQGLEDEEVQSCLEIEPVIYDQNANSINGDLDNSTNNESDAAAIHTEKNNEVEIILNTESEIDADKVTNGDKGSTIIDAEKATNGDKGSTIIDAEKAINGDKGSTIMVAEKDKEVRNFLEITPKSYDDSAEDDKDCITINAGKNDKVQNTLEITQKIGHDAAVDDSTNDGNDTTVIYLKKDNAVQHYLGIEPEINDDFFEDDNCTNGNNDSTNANDTLAMCAEKNKEDKNKVSSKQNNFEKESEPAFNTGASTSAMPVEKVAEIQYVIELESDHESNDGDAILADECNEVQNNVEIQPAYASNNNEVLPPTIEEDELQNESESGESDDASTVSSDNNILKVRLKRVHSSIFGEFIDFIYSGQYKTTDIKQIKDLLIAARDYGICDLEHKCIMHLRSQISIETSDDIYSFASVCKCDDLRTYVLDYLKGKIIGRKRRNIRLIQLIEQGIGDVADEEGMTTIEKVRWLKVMRNHPTYFKDVLKLKKGRKIRQVFSRFFPETSFDDDDIMADCRERLEYILNWI